MFKTIKVFEDYNARRYGAPWAAAIGADGRPDFNNRVSFFTGDPRNGEGGELCIKDPVENQVYIYGQKDNRGNNTFSSYVLYRSGEFVSIDKKELTRYL